MKVRSGWNSEYARKKYDIELDESDLARILQDAGLPLEVQPKLALKEAHALLYLNAEITARVTLGRYDSGLKDELAKEITALRAELANVLEAIRKKHDGAG